MPGRQNSSNGNDMVAMSSGNRYRMIERLTGMGDDFHIQDDQGARVFKVDGKTLSARETTVFRNVEGHVLCEIQQFNSRNRDLMVLQGPDGLRLAIVQKTMVSPLRDRFVIKVTGKPDLDVAGNVLAFDYRIGNVATVSRKWFRLTNSYGVEIEPGQENVLILAATVCIDRLSSDVR